MANLSTMEMASPPELNPLVGEEVEEPSSKTRSSTACRRFGMLAGAVLVLGALVFAGRSTGAPAAATSLLGFLRLTTIYLPPDRGEVLAEQTNNAFNTDTAKATKVWNKLAREMQNATGWPPANLLHHGEDCWAPCGNVSGDCAWCGIGNACCRYQAKNDPPECDGVTFTETRWHTCVVPSKPHTVKHWDQDCFLSCHGKSGYCDWCGSGNACCRKETALMDARECHNAVVFPKSRRYMCVATTGLCPMGMIPDGSGGCKKPESAPLLNFYVFKAVGPSTHAHFNLSGNAGSLGGMLWYLHNDIVTYCPRRYGIDRIKRFLITMKASESLYSQTGKNFDSYATFVKAKVADDDWDDDHWKKWGYNPGCRWTDPKRKWANYQDAIWYSLPGVCPSHDYNSKTAACKQAEPGGMCEHPDGTDTCTWSAEPAGEVYLDELAGIPDYDMFCAGGNYEYDLVSDAGIGNSFWNYKLDAASGSQRIHAVHELFSTKYPSMPGSLGRRPCDAEE